MVANIGRFAAICCEPRQVRKEATVAADSGAEVWLVLVTTLLLMVKKSMSYQVLARKWRPRSFKEMVGQEHILRMLINALDTQRLHHAYLFTGTRGVGKTTLARLLAKCLNCETGVTSNPCDTCGTCQAIDAGRFLDLLEIDAASRTKVEDTRELLENVQYAPTQGRYKVYLIDEVHMLSGHSFNALLKTLEEPPAHVKFLLATTDPKRLPITILSRCLQFNLKRVPVEQISQQLQHICKAENIAYELPALEQLAHAADGSLRDALSLLDQAIAYCNNSLLADDVRRMLGQVEQSHLFNLLRALAEQNGNQLLEEISQLSEEAPDYQQLLENLLSILHQIAIKQTIPTTEQHATVTELAERFTAQDVQLYYQIALIGRRDLALAPNALHGFEMVLMRMLAFTPMTGEPQHQSPTSAPAKKVASAVAAPVKPIENNASPVSEWTALLNQLKLTGMTLALAANCALEKMSDETIELILSNKHEPLLNKKSVERLEEALTQHYNKTMKLNIKLSPAELDTTAKQQDQAQKARLATAVESIASDQHVQKIMDVFGATLDINSVKAMND